VGSYLGKAAILAADDLQRQEVHVPEWADPETGADTVLIRGLTGAERDEYEASMVRQRGNEMVANLSNIRAGLVLRCCIDENGNRLFTSTDLGALGEKSAAALDRVFEAASELSRLNQKDIEELAGNSGAAPGGDSASA
jgi:hypothetical protein